MLTLLAVILCGCHTSQKQVQASYSYHEVTFSSSGARLSGGLWLPATKGPHPAMVIGHGSGRTTKDNARDMARHFVEAGLAVLTYDKRGVGQSEGSYEGKYNTSERNLMLLADDVSAGISYLKALPAIDQRQIGVYGWSQAGWILPIVAARRQVKFMVLISGPTVTTGEENYYSELTGDGAVSTFDQEAISKKLAEKGPYGFDPRPFLQKVQAPALWLLGSEDRSIPIPETLAVLDQLINEDQKRFQYHVFDGADHRLRIEDQLVKDYWQLQDDFLFNTVGIQVAEE